MKTKYEIGQQVIVKPTWWRHENVGEILAYKFEKYPIQCVMYESSKYYIRINSKYFNWFNEDEIRSLDYEFDKDFEINLLDTMIDINLSEGNFEMVKEFNRRKQELLGGK